MAAVVKRRRVILLPLPPFTRVRCEAIGCVPCLSSHWVMDNELPYGPFCTKHAEQKAGALKMLNQIEPLR